MVVPLQTMFAAAGLHNTYIGADPPRLALPFGVLLMTQYFKAVSPELEEAALFDSARDSWCSGASFCRFDPAGAGNARHLHVHHAWNDFFWPLVSATEPEMYTLTVGLASMQTDSAQAGGIGSAMAQAILGALPMLVVYLFFQRYVIAAVSEWSAD